ncbi:DUF3592 domain-containing protein [Nocardiopsis coralliicola]
MDGETLRTVLPAAIGVLLCAASTGIGTAELARTAALRRRGICVPGRIDSVPTGGARGPVVFSFTTRDGRRTTATQAFASTTTRLHPGQEVTVAYDPHDPTRAHVARATQAGAAVAFLLAGAAAGGLALLFATSDLMP